MRSVASGSTARKTENTVEVGMVADKLCGSCRAWQADLTTLEGGYGQCRRRSPQVIEIEAGVTDHVWPITSTDDWCLDHLPAEVLR